MARKKQASAKAKAKDIVDVTDSVALVSDTEIESGIEEIAKTEVEADLEAGANLKAVEEIEKIDSEIKDIESKEKKTFEDVQKKEKLKAKKAVAEQELISDKRKLNAKPQGTFGIFFR